MKLKRIMSITLAAAMLAGVGCNNQTEYIRMTPEDSYAYESDVLGEGVLPVVSFCSPSAGNAGLANTITDEVLKLTKEGGVNVIMGHDVGALSEEEKQLAELCAKYDIGYMPSTNEQGYWRINAERNGFVTYDDLTEEEKAATDENFRNLLTELAKYENFFGIRFTDEDGYRQFSSAGAAKKVFDEVCSDKVFSHNLISSMGNSQMLDYGYSHAYMPETVPISAEILTGGYQFYLEKEAEIVNPTFMSYDGYPFTFQSDVLGSLHANQKQINDVARKYEKSTWGYLQAFGGEPNDLGEASRIPNYNEIEYQIGVMLGMGAKGLVLYTYFSTPVYSNSQVEYEIPIDENGNPSQMYYDFKKAFENMRGYQHILMDSVTKNVVLGGNTDEIAQRPPEEMVVDTFNELTGVESRETGVVVYCMNYQGKTALFVQNASIEEGAVADITLSFSRNVEVAVYRDGGETAEEGKHINLYDVPSGQAIMVVVG